MNKLLFFAFIVAAQVAIAAEPSIRIGSLRLVQVYAPSNSPVGLREYVPPGESAEAWTRLASVRTFAKEKKAKSYLERVADQVLNSHPSAKAVLLKHEKSGDYVLDFLTFTPDSKIAEWNLMRAVYLKGKGLIVYQYAARFPTNQQLGSAIVSERSAMVDPFMQATFQPEANQSSEPTATGVTPPAGAGDRAAGSRGSP